MKKIILFFAIIVVSFTVYSQSYQLTRDTLHIPSNSVCGFFEDPSGIFFYWINSSMITDGIHFYKEKDGTFKPYKEVQFSNEILDAFRNKSISFSSLVFISSDTVLSVTNEKISIIDLKNGKILRQISYNNDSNYSLLLLGHPQSVWNSQRRSLTFTLFYIGEYLEKRKQCYTGQLVAEVFPETGVVNKFPMEYPVMNIFKYSSIVPNLFNPITTFNGDKYVVGFSIIPLTYVYNVSLNKIDTLNICEDGYMPLPEYKNPTSTPNNYEDPNIASWIFSHTRIYDQLIYNPYKDLYYRFFYKISNTSQTDVLGVTILDNQLRVFGKNIIFDTPVSVYYPTSKGLYGCKPDYGFGIVLERLELFEK